MININAPGFGTNLGANVGNDLAATVPSAAPPQPSPGGNTYINSIENLLSSNQAELQSAIRQAATPIAGGHQAQMPLSLMPRNNQAPYAPLDHSRVVGKHNAKMQGIGNAITGTTNLIAAYKTAEDNKKSQQVASSVQTLMASQQAIDQAKQVLQTDPNNAAAKETLQHNTTVANGILDGPQGKAIMKGFDVNYTDPAQNKTPEHGMVQKAIALFNQKQQGSSGGANLENFQKATPTALASNTAAQAQVAALQQKQKDQTQLLKAIIPASIRSDSSAFVAQTRAAAEVLKAHNASSDQWDRIKERERFDISKLATEQKNRIQMVGVEVSAAAERERNRLNIVNSDPATVTKNAQLSQAEDVRLVIGIQGQISSYQTTLLTGESSLTPEQKDSINSTLRLLNQRLDYVKTNQTNHLNVWNTIKIANGLTPDVGGETDVRSNADAATDSLGTANAWDAADYLHSFPR